MGCFVKRKDTVHKAISLVNPNKEIHSEQSLCLQTHVRSPVTQGKCETVEYISNQIKY